MEEFTNEQLIAELERRGAYIIENNKQGCFQIAIPNNPGHPDPANDPITEPDLITYEGCF